MLVHDFTLLVTPWWLHYNFWKWLITFSTKINGYVMASRLVLYSLDCQPKHTGHNKLAAKN